MALTSPDNLPIVPGNDTGTWKSWINTIVTAVQAAFSKRMGYNYRWADATARAAQAGMVEDATGYQIDTKVTYRYNGTTWIAWSSDRISFTTTLANVTIGSGTQSFWYRYTNGAVEGEGNIVFSTGSSMGSSPTFTLPVALSSNYVANTLLGNGSVAATGIFPIQVLRNGSSTTVAQLIALTASGTYAGYANVTASVPGTFTTASTVNVAFRYQPA